MYSSIAIISIIAVAQAVNLSDWENCKANESAMKMRGPHPHHGEDFWWGGAAAEDMEDDMDMGMEYDLDEGIVVVEDEPMYEHEHGWMKSGHNENGWRGRGSHPKHGDWSQWAPEMEVELDDGIVLVEEEPMYEDKWMTNGWRGRGSHPRHEDWGHWASEEQVELDDGIAIVEEEPMYAHEHGWNKSGHKGRGRRSW